MLPSTGAQTTLEQMRPQGNSAHENEFLEFAFSFAPAEGLSGKIQDKGGSFWRREGNEQEERACGEKDKEI